VGLGRRHLLNVFAVFKAFYDELDVYARGIDIQWYPADMIAAPLARGVLR
jgi:hypothetical protein